jgi:hypothetical protein
MSETLSQNSALQAATMRRVSWRLMPFLMLAYLLCYIDRVNVGFASLQTFAVGFSFTFTGRRLSLMPRHGSDGSRPPSADGGMCLKSAKWSTWAFAKRPRR